MQLLALSSLWNTVRPVHSDDVMCRPASFSSGVEGLGRGLFNASSKRSMNSLMMDEMRDDDIVEIFSFIISSAVVEISFCMDSFKLLSPTTISFAASMLHF